MTSAFTRFSWERLVISERGPANPTTRHVLLALATHVNRDLQCWPTTKLLTAETGLSERSVCTHLEIADQEGWIKHTDRRTGKGWRNYIYSLTIPAVRAEPRSPASKDIATEPRSAGNAPNGEDRAEPGAVGAERHALAAEPDDNLALKDVQSNSNVQHFINKKSNNKEEKPFFYSDPSKPEQPKKKEPEHAKTETPSLDAKQEDALQTWAKSLGVAKWPEESDEEWLMHVKASLQTKAKADAYAARCYKRLFPSERVEGAT
jgi:hypothetical protein